ASVSVAAPVPSAASGSASICPGCPGPGTSASGAWPLGHVPPRAGLSRRSVARSWPWVLAQACRLRVPATACSRSITTGRSGAVVAAALQGFLHPELAGVVGHQRQPPVAVEAAVEVVEVTHRGAGRFGRRQAAVVATGDAHPVVARGGRHELPQARRTGLAAR